MSPPSPPSASGYEHADEAGVAVGLERRPRVLGRSSASAACGAILLLGETAAAAARSSSYSSVEDERSGAHSPDELPRAPGSPSARSSLRTWRQPVARSAGCEAERRRCRSSRRCARRRGYSCAASCAAVAPATRRSRRRRRPGSRAAPSRRRRRRPPAPARTTRLASSPAPRPRHSRRLGVLVRCEMRGGRARRSASSRRVPDVGAGRTEQLAVTAGRRARSPGRSACHGRAGGMCTPGARFGLLARVARRGRRRRTDRSASTRSEVLRRLRRQQEQPVDERVEERLPRRLDDVLAHADRGPGPVAVRCCRRAPG